MQSNWNTLAMYLLEWVTHWKRTLFSLHLKIDFVALPAGLLASVKFGTRDLQCVYLGQHRLLWFIVCRTIVASHHWLYATFDPSWSSELTHRPDGVLSLRLGGQNLMKFVWGGLKWILDGVGRDFLSASRTAPCQIFYFSKSSFCALL